MRQASHQTIATHLHSLYQGHENNHRTYHHLVIKTLIAVANGKIPQPATANDV